MVSWQPHALAGLMGRVGVTHQYDLEEPVIAQQESASSFVKTGHYKFDLDGAPRDRIWITRSQGPAVEGAEVLVYRRDGSGLYRWGQSKRIANRRVECPIPPGFMGVVAVVSGRRVLDFHAAGLKLGTIFGLTGGRIVQGAAEVDWVDALSAVDNWKFERHFRRLWGTDGRPDWKDILRAFPQGVVRASVLRHLGFNFADELAAIRHFESGSFLDLFREVCPEIHALDEQGALAGEKAFRWALLRFGRILV